MTILFLLLIAILILLIFISYVSTRQFDYWKKKNVPYLKPSGVFGNFKDYILLRKCISHVADEICEQFPDAPYVGAFYGTEPTLLIKDPEIIKIITTKDFYAFNGREISKYTDNEVMTRNIFFTYGDKWKLIRHYMSPLFSSAKLKRMFPLIHECVTTFDALLDQEVAVSSQIEVRALMASYTMDSIGSCVFGLNTNVMKKDPTNPFVVIGEKIFETTNYRGYKAVARAVWPSIFYGLGFKTFSPEIGAFFNNLLTGVFQKRLENEVTRHDFVDLILELKQNKYLKGDSLCNTRAGKPQTEISLRVDDDFLVAQCISLFAAGYETSAVTLSLTLFELAKNKDAQAQAIAEVDEYLKKHDGIIDYECNTELPYLAACFEEAMRVYPLLGVLTREVMENYTLPTGLRLDKGVRIHIPVYHIHHNAKYFPEPEKYRPERFLGKEKNNIEPFTFLPFGEGPRFCIGKRFATMQMYPAMITILKKFTVDLAVGTPETLELEPKAMVTVPTGGIWLEFTPRSTTVQNK